jgi:O-antigen ligase
MEVVSGAVYTGNPLPFEQKLLTCAILLFSGCYFGQSRRIRHQWLNLVVFFQVIIALYSSVNYFLGNDLLLWFQRLAYTSDQTGTFVNRNSYATFVGIALLLVLQRFVKGYRELLRDRENLSHWMSTIVERFLIMLVLIFSLLGTHSRAGTLSVLLGAIAYLSMSRNAQNSKQKKFGSYLLIAGLTIVVIVSSFSHFELLDARMGKADDDFLANRYLVYEQTWSAIWQSPWLGYGVGSFAPLFRVVQPQELVFVTFDKAHNVYLELMFELGIPVSVLLIGSIGVLIFHLAKLSNDTGRVVIACWLMAAVHGLVDFSLQIPAVAYLMFALTGVALGSAVGEKRRSRQGSGKSRLRKGEKESTYVRTT